MNKKASATIIGGIIGALAFGICTQNIYWAIAGAILGSLIATFIVISQKRMAKDRETGLDG